MARIPDIGGGGDPDIGGGRGGVVLTGSGDLQIVLDAADLSALAVALTPYLPERAGDDIPGTPLLSELETSLGAAVESVRAEMTRRRDEARTRLRNA